MKKYINKIVIITVLVVVVSCEKVIEIDLNSADPTLVAEGQIEAGKTGWIRLSYTSDYFSSESNLIEENAEVELMDEFGNSEILKHNENGLYTGEKILGQYNTTYTLTVTFDDEVYRVETTIPYKIDSINFEARLNGFNGFGPGAGGDYTLVSIFPDDIQNEPNYFLLSYTSLIPDTVQTGMGRDRGLYTLFEDRNITNDGIIRYAPIGSAQNADVPIEVSLSVVDKKVYTYYSHINSVTSSNPMNSAAPFNPHSNFDGNILGCFMGVSSISDVVTINSEIIN